MLNKILTKNTYLILVGTFFITHILLACESPSQDKNEGTDKVDPPVEKSGIQPAANRTGSYLALLKGKRVAVVANQTSVIEQASSTPDQFMATHLVDSLLSHGIDIKRVFAPEHGFRGQIDAGEQVADDKDVKTGLPLISLYGKNKKPGPDLLGDIDLVLFDIQDVGVRFYTYISTLTYVMEACAEQGIPVMVLDRPNPNAHYVDGPFLDPEHSSFVGMHPIPLVYGMTIGEYGRMVNGEKWLLNGVQCDLTVIEVGNYNHEIFYSLPIRPSPNLPNDTSISLYPSLGFFEGTPINAGRGTEFQFQRYGAPFFPESDFSYVPAPNFGSKSPKFNGERCFGVDLSATPRMNAVNIEWIVDAYNKTPEKKDFFGKTFTIHAGSEQLQKQLEAGLTADEIHASWQEQVNAFKAVREKYLIYP